MQRFGQSYLVAGRGVLLFAATDLLLRAVLGSRSDAQGLSQPLDEKRSKVQASGLTAGRDRRFEPDQVSGACRQSIERSTPRLQADARRGPPACRAALLRCRFVGDARRRAGAGPAGSLVIRELAHSPMATSGGPE